MKSKRVQLIVLGVAVVALVGIVLRSTGRSSSASEEAARLVSGAGLGEDSPIEETSTVQRARPSEGTTQSAGRLGDAQATPDAALSDPADEEKTERKINKGRAKRSGRRKSTATADTEDIPASAQGPKVRISGNRAKKGGP